ncbi:hypothetical protein SAMN06265219_11758 [Gracilimonas mengyeensis]|uniref:Uncharacterized protein n=1 Tax=Gracilimonas mengyeensis TaxID=1302730 RepID=A0A521FD69_9BACT|nr:hypothetical protein SAMN06265219_11758 [Gracilimonas mengyeensis]
MSSVFGIFNDNTFLFNQHTDHQPYKENLSKPGSFESRYKVLPFTAKPSLYLQLF